MNYILTVKIIDFWTIEIINFLARARRVRQKADFAEQIQRCHIVLLISSSSAK